MTTKFSISKVVTIGLSYEGFMDLKSSSMKIMGVFLFLELMSLRWSIVVLVSVFLAEVNEPPHGKFLWWCWLDCRVVSLVFVLPGVFGLVVVILNHHVVPLLKYRSLFFSLFDSPSPMYWFFLWILVGIPLEWTLLSYLLAQHILQSSSWSCSGLGISRLCPCWEV